RLKSSCDMAVKGSIADQIPDGFAPPEVNERHRARGLRRARERQAVLQLLEDGPGDIGQIQLSGILEADPMQALQFTRTAHFERVALDVLGIRNEEARIEA